MRTRAFTLIELLVVISIIALLSSIVLASLNSARDKARVAAGKQFAASVAHAAGDYLVGSWDFDECSGSSAADKSNNGNTGVLANSPSWQTDTPYGTGCSLLMNGTNSYVEMSDSPSLDVTGQITISAWVKRASQKGDEKVVFKVPAPNNQGYGTGIVNQKYEFGVTGISCDIRNAPGGVALAQGVWYQLVATYDGTACKTYVNGALDRTSNGSGTFVTTAATLRIGADQYSNPPSYNFSGYIDNVQIFAKALTAAEVKDMYLAQSQARHFARK